MDNKIGIASQGCRHPSTALEFTSTGGFHLTGGDLWSDEKEIVICKACGRDVTAKWDKKCSEAKAFLKEFSNG